MPTPKRKPTRKSPVRKATPRKTTTWKANVKKSPVWKAKPGKSPRKKVAPTGNKVQKRVPKKSTTWKSMWAMDSNRCPRTKKATKVSTRRTPKKNWKNSTSKKNFKAAPMTHRTVKTRSRRKTTYRAWRTATRPVTRRYKK